MIGYCKYCDELKLTGHDCKINKWQSARIVALEAELLEAKDEALRYRCQVRALKLTSVAAYSAYQFSLTIVTAQRDAAVEALKPFSDAADTFNDIPGVYRCADDVPLSRKSTHLVVLSVGDLRRARSVLASIVEKEI